MSETECSNLPIGMIAPFSCKRDGTFAINDIMAKRFFGGMERFVEEPKREIYQKAELADATGGQFMTRSEAGHQMLKDSTILTGLK